MAMFQISSSLFLDLPRGFYILQESGEDGSETLKISRKQKEKAEEPGLFFWIAEAFEQPDKPGVLDLLLREVKESAGFPVRFIPFPENPASGIIHTHLEIKYKDEARIVHHVYVVLDGRDGYRVTIGGGYAHPLDEKGKEAEFYEDLLAVTGSVIINGKKIRLDGLTPQLLAQGFQLDASMEKNVIDFTPDVTVKWQDEGGLTSCSSISLNLPEGYSRLMHEDGDDEGQLEETIVRGQSQNEEGKTKFSFKCIMRKGLAVHKNPDYRMTPEELVDALRDSPELSIWQKNYRFPEIPHCLFGRDTFAFKLFGKVFHTHCLSTLLVFPNHCLMILIASSTDQEGQLDSGLQMLDDVLAILRSVRYEGRPWVIGEMTDEHKEKLLKVEDAAGEEIFDVTPDWSRRRRHRTNF